MKTARDIFQFIKDNKLIFERKEYWAENELDWNSESEEKLNEFLKDSEENQIKEETVTLTIGEIFNRADHPSDCGLNEWCVNEGRADYSDLHTITKSQAIKFMSDFEFATRKN